MLGIEAISGPATAMLNEILAAIPNVLKAALWIGIAFIAARFLKTFIEAILPPTGFDEAIRSTGILPADASASRIVANIAMIVLILAASIEAARRVGGDDIAIFLAQVTALGSKVIFGTLIIVAGIFLSNIIAKLVGSGTGEGGFAQTHRPLCDHRSVHRDRPDLHGSCRPDRDARLRADSRFCRHGDRAGLRPRRARRRGAALPNIGRRESPVRACASAARSASAARRATTASRLWSDGG